MYVDAVAIECSVDLSDQHVTILAPVREIIVSICSPRSDHREHENAAVAELEPIGGWVATTDSMGAWAMSNSTRPEQHVGDRSAPFMLNFDGGTYEPSKFEEVRDLLTPDDANMGRCPTRRSTAFPSGSMSSATPTGHRSSRSERFADDIAELVDRVAGGGPVDLWGHSLGALTATGVAVRHPAKVRRLVLAAVHIRPDGYHPEIVASEQDDPRLPSEEEFAAWRADYEAVAPDPEHFFAFLERLQPVVDDWPGWTDGEIRSVTAPALLVIGDQDFVRLDHAAEMLDLFPDCRLAVLPGTKHTEVMLRSEQLRTLVGPFLS